MEPADSQPIKLYGQTQVLIGNIHLTSHPEARLSDALNGISDTGPVRRGRFLQLTDVTVRQADGRAEKLTSAYINKATVQLAVTLGGVDSGRGIGAKNGSKSYPFLEKAPRPVRIETDDYIINGNMYCMNGQRVRQILEDTATFLPLTHTRVCTVANGTWEEFPFAAVNKDRILSLQDSNME